jgi:LPS export ABC transporter protein LptC
MPIQFDPLNRSFAVKTALTTIVGLTIVLSLQGCIPGFKSISQDEDTGEPLADLVLNNVTLDQTNEKGEVLWKLKADRATYDDDRKLAKVENISGILFQNNKPTYAVEAKTGEVYRDGERIVLKEQVVVKYLPEEGVLTGRELEWYPDQETLAIRGSLTGKYKDLEFTTQEARFEGKDTQVLALRGSIVALLGDSHLRLKTESLEWHIADRKVIGPNPTLLERFDPEDPKKVLEWARGERSSLDLAAKRSTLETNAKVSLAKPELDISSDRLIWDARNNQVETDKPVQILDRKNQTQVSADRGAMNLGTKVATLDGNVNGFSPQQQSRLLAEHVTWKISEKLIEATGNIVYTSENPKMVTTGDEAIGHLEEGNIQVKSSRAVKTVYTLQ